MPAEAQRQQERLTWHIARHFEAAPDVARAHALLDEIVAGEPMHLPVSLDMPLGLYGAGNLGRMAREFLMVVGRDFDFVMDRNAESLRSDSVWGGKPIYHPDEAPDALKHSHQLLVTVATAPQAPLEEYLADLGFRNIVPFYDFSEQFRHVHPLSNGWRADLSSAFDPVMVREALSGFADDISRAHHLQFLAWRRLRQEWIFECAPVTGNDRFFIPEVTACLGEGEVFLDAGAHEGSVTLLFDRLVSDWKDIVAIEPDSANRAKLEADFAERWQRTAARRPQVLDCALGSHAHAARFHDGLGYASQLAETGSRDVEVTTIDALGMEPTFIKLHLEGAELAVLRGAERTLRSARPIVAATVYHNDDGIWKTPLWMMRNLKDYRFLFRLHSWCGTGAVLYAIPSERMPA